MNFREKAELATLWNQIILELCDDFLTKYATTPESDPKSVFDTWLEAYRESSLTLLTKLNETNPNATGEFKDYIVLFDALAGFLRNSLAGSSREAHFIAVTVARQLSNELLTRYAAIDAS